MADLLANGDTAVQQRHLQGSAHLNRALDEILERSEGYKLSIAQLFVYMVRLTADALKTWTFEHVGEHLPIRCL